MSPPPDDPTPRYRRHCVSRPVPRSRVTLHDAFWSPLVDRVHEVALPTQLDQYKHNCTLHNFRVAAGEREGVHEGWFFQDSDLYKWIEAAAYIAGATDDAALRDRVRDLVELIARAQRPNGYLNTYYSVLFPDRQWTNLYIAHELYVAGHLFEAGVACAEVLGERTLLDVATRCADLIVEEWARGTVAGPPGHPEVELALVRLYRATGREDYLTLARELVAARGDGGLRKSLGRGVRFLKEQKRARERRAAFYAEHALTPPEGRAPVSSDWSSGTKPSLWTKLRAAYLFATGRWALDHKPVGAQAGPVGHAVRATYLYAGMTDLVAETADPTLRECLEETWARMVHKRMYVTGGIGALPVVEGFGRDYELPNATAYAETCAAIGNALWNWRMTLLTGEARFGEVFERCLYNGALAGFGLDGKHYFYENRLESRGGVQRREWYPVACCPSNLARLLGRLPEFAISHATDAIWVHQYLGGEAQVLLAGNRLVQCQLESHLPWDGRVRLRLAHDHPSEFSLHLRVPWWTREPYLKINAEKSTPLRAGPTGYCTVEREWAPDDELALLFPTPVRFLRAHPKVKADRGKVAVQRGPVIFCLESVDNPGVEVFAVQLDAGGEWTFQKVTGFGAAPWEVGQLRGPGVIDGTEHLVTLIPYFAWANRGGSQMRVWIPHAGDPSHAKFDPLLELDA